MYSLYFIRSETNNRVYVGYTSKSVDERLKEHNQGKNKWTKNNRPFKLMYFEQYYCSDDAKNREKFYKMGFGKKIKKLIIDNI
ncbi:MAG: Excinuclease ABC C subunit domain protein [Berkelbacteria bacterium GW2011_GWA2_35_9]|uniref:Excinuclease ABC C subunit domain protein n=1 Tax=Berkelbacteria bacterium GW2011_GWA2_35_9 TaxID=1618333 RepID=A0A0G0DIX9_9BACT|nr:MAG: Excinuclease ABC C subunit domain protein [Berkelbacteria bacterium GW2011_GWA2_35_9]